MAVRLPAESESPGSVLSLWDTTILNRLPEAHREPPDPEFPSMPSFLAKLTGKGLTSRERACQGFQLHLFSAGQSPLYTLMLTPTTFKVPRHWAYIYFKGTNYLQELG